MKIYTRGGDQGETGLRRGLRVAKDDPRVEAYGVIDEVSSLIGMARAAGVQPSSTSILLRIQAELFSIGAYLADPGVPPGSPGQREPDSAAPVGDPEVEAFERAIDGMDEEMEPLRQFILPGGSAGAAALHLARSVTRRAERRIVALFRKEDPEGRNPKNGMVLRYLNRLSDLLFVMARFENTRRDIEETIWAG
ncbi:MAG: cob(I)yrinic acid a,c-diamide adenosyltransferase [Firmicutes bacterium]|nr:cob(I)yrinic acid a,c-diamide adenosyltransferase [Bacillota bacterium]